MSKTYFGRCAAVGVAGLTAMSSMVSLAMVASAEAYPTNVYEFTYGGIGATIQFAGKVNSLELDNEYLSAATAAKVFKNTSGFTFDANALAAFTGIAGDFVTSANFSADNWTYTNVNALTGAPTVVVPAEYAEDRGAGLTFYFKSKAERDTAVNTIVNANVQEYKSKLSAASSALSTDFSTTITAYRNATTKKISDIRAAADKYFRDNPTTDSVLVTALQDASGAAYNLTYLDGAVATIYRKAADGDTSSQWASKQNTFINDKVKFLNDIATKAKKEFNEMYAYTNYAFDDYKYDVAANCKAIIIDDSLTSVTFGSHVGQFIKPVTATYDGPNTVGMDLSTCYYRTSGQYVNSKSYAFTGEIIKSATRLATGNPSYVSTYLLDSDRWSDFSAVIEGKPTDNGNTTESGNSGNTTTDKTTTTATTWYPDSASYRAASEVSYKGNNGSWYTSSSAASIYGGGYSGVSKSSNYSTVNSSASGKTIYFDSTSGTYSTSSSSYSYVVKEGTGTSDSSNDPYYSHIWGGTTNNTTTTVPAGSPAIRGASKYAGWTNISAYITNRAKSGSTYSINMNDESIVPASVLAAAKAKNVTLTFVNDNGSKVTVKPGKVSTTSDLKVSVTYNVKDVKTSLVKKAKKVNPGTVSTAQVRIGNDGSIGGTATVNVKFSTKRSGCTVKAYRLTASGSLVKEATGTVASTGRVNLNLTKGGSYLLVVID